MAGAAIHIQDVRKVYRSSQEALVALERVTLDIQPREFVCLLGPSGCGKSTLLNIIGGLDQPSGGEVVLGLPGPSGSVPGRRPSVAFVFQEPRLLPWRTVVDNVRFALDSKRAPRQQWDESIRWVLDLVGLTAFAHYYPYQLSGGMQQRTAIARALAVRPDILLMDEPFSGLDEITARQLREELLRIWTETRQIVVFVTHNAFEAAFLADRVVILTGHPGTVHADIRVPIPRPRTFDDPAQFAFGVQLVKEFLQLRETLRDGPVPAAV